MKSALYNISSSSLSLKHVIWAVPKSIPKILFSYPNFALEGLESLACPSHFLSISGGALNLSSF